MLDKITSELSKLIAQDIYTAAKKMSGAAVKSLKSAGLKQSGTGLPPDFAKEFHRAFVLGMIHHQNGYTKFQEDKTEITIPFELVLPLITRVQNHCKWQNAATTKVGVELVAALGGGAEFQKRMNESVPQLVKQTINAAEGRYFSDPNLTGWRILTPVQTIDVAHRGKRDFAPCELFYIARGTEKETKKAYSHAKKFLFKPWFGKKPIPSEGPYFT